MTRQFESPQLSLFNEDKPRAVLEPAQKVALATLVQLLLREIATALATAPANAPHSRSVLRASRAAKKWP